MPPAKSFTTLVALAGSLLLLAGPNGLGNGGWGQSGIADLLPARLPPLAVDSFHRYKVPVRLTPQGADKQMLRLAPPGQDNRAAWSDLPDIADYQELAVGRPRQFSVVFERWIVMLSFLNRDYGLLLVADERIGPGRARFELRRARLALDQDLA